MRTENWITFKKITFYAKKISQIQDMKIAYPIRKHIYSEQLFFYPFLRRIKRGGREEIKTAPKVRATSSLQLSAWLPGASWAAYPQFLRGQFFLQVFFFSDDELREKRNCIWPDIAGSNLITVVPKHRLIHPNQTPPQTLGLTQTHIVDDHLDPYCCSRK